MAATGEFERLTHSFVEDYLEFYPMAGAGLGLHAYDGRAGSYSRESIDGWMRGLGAWQRRLAALDASLLSPQEAHDAALIAGAIEHDIFGWETLREHEWNPISWSAIPDVTGYLKRDYAPLQERLRALASHLEEIPRALGEARSHLAGPLPAPVVEAAVEVYEGFDGFYGVDLGRHGARIDDPTLRSRFESAREAAHGALRAFSAFLDEARGRAKPEFAIGEAAFCGMLRTGEMVTAPLDRLLELGAEELAALSSDAEETAARVDPSAPIREVMASLGQDHPSAGSLVQETEAMLEGLRRFLLEREIVTLPGEVRPLVEETPAFLRWAFAMMDTAGPLETAATESYYYITPPEKEWPPEKRDEWLTKFDYATLKAVSIHEAYPGHFIHFMHVRGAPSLAAKVFTSYSFAEGWAHYCEEMMLEAGVDEDPRFRLAQIGEALVRLVRYVVAIRMHTGEMDLDAATRMFVERAFMEPLTARKEAIRGTFDPGYLNYTLGKFMVRKLRDDYRGERRTAFALRDFHDRLIGLGAPPVPLARRALLEHDTGLAL